MRSTLVYLGTLLTFCHAHLRSSISAGTGSHHNHESTAVSTSPIDSAIQPARTNVTHVSKHTANVTNATLDTYIGKGAKGVPVDWDHAPVKPNATYLAADTTPPIANTRSNFSYLPLDTYGFRAEYFANVVSCAGKDFLLTRLEPFVRGSPMLAKYGWQTRVREVGDFSKDLDELPSAILSHNTLSHNVAGLCVGNKVYLVGGQFRKDRSEPHWKGVWIAEANPKSLHTFTQISTPRLMFPGDHTGCVEGRDAYNKEHGGGCEFDGRFSLIHFRGKFVLFGRANLKYQFRSVQMTQSEDLESWSPFQRIKVRDIIDTKSNIYFLVATVMKHDEKIAGYFPGQVIHQSFIDDEAGSTTGIHVMWSDNGLQWSSPVNVYKSKGLYGIHPVGMLNNRLLTQRPSNIAISFEMSQKFTQMEEMNRTLTLTALGKKNRLMRTAVSYDIDIWNE